MHNGYGIAFDGVGHGIFVSDSVKNVVNFVVGNNSSANSYKNNFLLLGECPTYGINGSFGSLEKKLVLILIKQTQNFA